MTHVGEKIALCFARCFRGVARLPESFLGQLAISDVVRNAKRAGDLAVRISDRHARDRDPVSGTIRPLDGVLNGDERQSRLDNLAVAFPHGIGVRCVCEKTCGIAAHGLFGTRQPQSRGHCLVDSQIVSVAVFEENVVRDTVQQARQQKAFLLKRLFDKVPVGDVPEDSLNADDVSVRVVDRRLHHLDPRLVALGIKMRFGRVEHPTALHDGAVIRDVLVSQFGWKQVVVCCADHFLGSAFTRLAVFPIGKRDGSVKVLAEKIQREVVDERFVECFRVPQFLLGLSTPFEFRFVLLAGPGEILKSRNEHVEQQLARSGNAVFTIAESNGEFLRRNCLRGRSRREHVSNSREHLCRRKIPGHVTRDAGRKSFQNVGRRTT